MVLNIFKCNHLITMPLHFKGLMFGRCYQIYRRHWLPHLYRPVSDGRWNRGLGLWLFCL